MKDIQLLKTYNSLGMLGLINYSEIEKELAYLGLLDKSKEIYCEFGEKAFLSYIRASYRLLSKVYHPDLNPTHKAKAKIAQQRLNKFSRLLSRMSDKELIDLMKRGSKAQYPIKKKILIVEDEIVLQELLRHILVIEGYMVRVASDGDRGYEEYCQFRPDLVLTDIVMPEMSGLELTSKIREISPGIKVIFISGFLDMDHLRTELDAEIFRYGYGTLSKPFKISEMLEMVRASIHGFQARRFNVNVYA